MRIVHAGFGCLLLSLVCCGGEEESNAPVHSFGQQLDDACRDPSTLSACSALERSTGMASFDCNHGGPSHSPGCRVETARVRAVRARLAQLRLAARTDIQPVATAAETVTTPAAPTATDQAPTDERVQAAVIEATRANLTPCGLVGKSALVGAELEVKTTGDVASVKINDASLGAAEALACIRNTLSFLKFSPYKMPPPGKGAAMRCPPGVSVFRTDLCQQVIADSRSYLTVTMVSASGAVTHPTAAEESQVRAQLANDAKTAACAATKASGFAPGTYTAQASQNVTTRDGSKVRGWKSLTITVDANGCMTWRGLDAGHIWMPGDDARDIQTISATCITEGDGSITKTATGFHLAANVRGTASGGTPTRYHVWKCGSANVEAPLNVDLSSHGCVALGGAADATEERAAAVGCGISNAFGELRDRNFTIDRSGAIRMPLTIVDPSTLTMHRVDSKRP